MAEGRGSCSPEDNNPLNRRTVGGSPSSDEDPPNPNDNNGNPNNNGRRCPNYDEDPEDCCNTSLLRHAVSSNFQLERDINYAGGALVGIHEACDEHGVQPDHPSIANLQAAYDDAVSPESCWNRSGTTYHERALARLENPHDFFRMQGRLNDALDEVEPQFGPSSGSAYAWQRGNVPERENTSELRDNYERDLGQVICRDHAEPYLAASAFQQQQIGEMGYGRYPQSVITQGSFNRSTRELPPNMQNLLEPMRSEMDYLDRQRETFTDEVDSAVCGNCLRGLDADYDGYTVQEERDLNEELRADPARCRRNRQIGGQLIRSRVHGPAPGSRDVADHVDDLFPQIGHVPRTLSNDELVARRQSGHVWGRPTTCPPDDGRYNGVQAHPTECLCGRMPNCNCSGCRSDRENQDRRAMAVRDQRQAARRPDVPSGSGVCGPRNATRSRAAACDPGPLGPRPGTPSRRRPGAQMRARIAPCAALGADPGEDTMVIDPGEDTMVINPGDETLVIDMAAEAEREAAAAQEAAAAAEVASVAAQGASDAMLRSIRAQNRAARQAGAGGCPPAASSRDFSTIPIARPDTPRNRNRNGRRQAAAAAPAAAVGPQAGLADALRAEEVAAAAAVETAAEARLRCARAKRLADKAEKASRNPTRRSERVKRKQIADTGVVEDAPGCPPGCQCASCVADRDSQQGPSKRPNRGGGGGAGGAGGCGGGGGQGVCA